MWQSLLASVIFFILLLVASSGWYLLRRKSLLSLFQVSKNKPLIIYLSRIDVRLGGSLGADGAVRSYAGPTVTAAEASAATLLSSLFEQLIPGLEAQPGILKSLFIRDISVQIQPSPASIQEIPDDVSIVTVGSPGYNWVSSWAQQKLNPKIWFSPNNDGLITHSGEAFKDPTIGMVQVFYDARNQRRVFYVAGLAEAGTQAALLYLSKNWKELKRNLGKDEVYAGFVKLVNGRVRLSQTIH